MPLSTIRTLARTLVHASSGIILLAATGCGGGGGGAATPPAASGTTNVSLSALLSDEIRSAIAAGSTVTAQATLDGGAPVTLTVGATDATATLTMSNGALHSVNITFTVSNAGGTVTAIGATAQKTGFNPTVDGATLTLAASALGHLDDDGDGFINLVEVALATDTALATSHPGQSGTMGSATGTLRLAATVGVIPAASSAAPPATGPVMGVFGSVAPDHLSGGTITLTPVN
ncbi:MAG: hypothetical protein OEW11_11450 [Nitrospirota bacterium]|nr:hypothetical protein [Nitrospirota bacterium]